MGMIGCFFFFFFFQAEDGIRDADVTGVQTCALPISAYMSRRRRVDAPLGPGLRVPARRTWASGAAANPVAANNRDASGSRTRNRRPSAMAVVTMKQLLESGVHFGHQTRR